MMKQFFTQIIKVLGTTLAVTVAMVTPNIDSIQANQIANTIIENMESSTFAEKLNFLNETAIASLQSIDEVTGDNLTGEFINIANQAVELFNQKMTEVENGTYDADKEMEIIQNAALEAITSIEKEGYGLTDEQKAELEQTIRETAEAKIKEVTSENFNEETEIEKLNKIAEESIEIINNAGRQSLESINNSMTEAANNENLDKDTRGIIENIKDKTSEIINQIF